jgi:CBS domain-containing protein
MNAAMNASRDAAQDAPPEATPAEPVRELLTLATARVRDAYVRKPFYVEGSMDLVSVCRLLAERGLTHALVRDGGAAAGGAERLGIFTTTSLRDALLKPTPPAQLPVREVARFDLVTVDARAELFEALWLMVRHRVHRLVVKDGTEVLGVLGQLDLVSFVANHSHLIGAQIDEAASIAELKAAAARIDELVALLHGSGIRIERVARLVGALNARLIARLWSLLAPPELVANSCLLLLGSEGRSEQILKTDQDNALLLRDGYLCAELEDVAQRFAAALGEFGWPPCPGGIMLTNARWRQPLAAFRETLAGWVRAADPEGVMQLAIFLDAAAVAGDTTLLVRAREHVARLVDGADTFIARFAAAADQFSENAGWLARLASWREEQPLDLKKLGIFPIVHGVRALALQHALADVGTAERLRALVAGGHFDQATARDLMEALHLLMGVRLAHQLRRREQGASASNEVRAAELGTLERESLADALAIVKRFRAWLRQHFHLDALA